MESKSEAKKLRVCAHHTLYSDYPNLKTLSDFRQLTSTPPDCKLGQKPGQKSCRVIPAFTFGKRCCKSGNLAKEQIFMSKQLRKL